VLHPPLVGHGWLAGGGCCTPLGYHWDEVVVPIDGTLQAEQQFAIDYIQIGPNKTCCNGPATALTSWWGYNTPVLSAAPGVVVEAVDGIPDNDPVGTVTPEPAAGNHVVEDIGGGRYVSYKHLKPGSIPAWVRAGARLRPGILIGRVGNSGNNVGPHLHFEVTDTPLSYDAAGLPFVFDTQLLEGSVSEADLEGSLRGAIVAVDRTRAGVRRGLMPARNGVFGYNLPH
jgi:Peptidase family M23